MQSLRPPGWAEAEPKCEEATLENERKIQEETPMGFDPHLKIYRHFFVLIVNPRLRICFPLTYFRKSGREGGRKEEEREININGRETH